MDLSAFAETVGASDPVTVSGAGTRGGPMPDARCVAAPSGIVEFEPAEMTVRCGAGTTVNELLSTLAEAGQSLALPAGGTVGGALACGRTPAARTRPTLGSRRCWSCSACPRTTGRSV